MRTKIACAVVCCVLVACSGGTDDTEPEPNAGSGGGSGGEAPSGSGGGAPSGSGGGSVDPNDGFTDAEVAAMKTLSPLPSVPPDPTNQYADSAMAAALGQMLFHEKSYSGAIAVG